MTDLSSVECIDLEFGNIDADCLILTPNRRLSAWLIRDHDSVMAQGTASTWEQLNAMPLDAWWQQLYQQVCLLLPPAVGEASHPRLLTTRQASLLWRQVIERDNDLSVDADGFVQLAQQARALACRWRFTALQWQNGDKLEHQRFAHWHQAFLERLQQDNLMDTAGLPEWIFTRGESLRATLPRRFLLHGFNDHSEPQLVFLAGWLRADGIEVRFSQRPARSGQTQVAAFPQLDDQFGAAIQWALSRHSGTGRIGIVIPNLQSLRARIRQLCQSLWAQQADAAGRHWTDVINITAGQPLLEYPIVSHALLLLRAMSGNPDLQEWQVLLGSPYFPLNENEWLRRDAFIDFLRKKNLPQLTLSQLEKRWQQFSPQPGLTGEWLATLLTLQGGLRNRPAQGWVNWLMAFLRDAGWCQGRTLNSEEYQVQQRMQESFAEVTALDEWLGTIGFESFRSELMETLRNVQFQPQTETAPIQIMGILEAAGLQFDQLWVCECEAVNWPQALNPNPLLPRREQRALNMPGASPERELQYASRLLDGFRRCADGSLFSWGHLQGDTEHTLSALLEDLPPMPDQVMAGFRHVTLEHRQFASGKDNIESLPADDVGLPVDQHHAKGGSGIIRSQSLCPFKAYAEFRLNIQSRDALTEGIKASDRGSLVHQVLEAFWREVKDWNSLQALIQYEAKLDALLRDIIAAQLAIFRNNVVLEPEALYRLEQERTFALVKHWLVEWDGGREPFVVAQVEKKKSLAIGGIELSLAVDRIDELADGSRVIIDYKTGDKDSKAWQGERPEEPQLPLYAMLEPDKTRGILFGILHNAKMAYNGLLENRDQFTRAKQRSILNADNWDEQMQQWQQTLQQLADEYVQGRASVAPLNDAVCQYCHLASLCRIREASRDVD